MELAYLWIEKNDLIKGTDFNFGSKYIFSFKKDDKENKGLLSLKINPDFIEKFYSENISISAIVGKNGTGKSQLLRLIWNGNITNNQYFAIFKDKDSFKLIGIKDENLKISIEEIEELDIDLKWNEKGIDNLTNIFYTNEAICLDSTSNLRSMYITKNHEFLSSECYKKDIINDNSSLLEDINSEIESQLDIIDNHQSHIENGIAEEGEEFIPDSIDNSNLEEIEKIVNKTYTYENIQDIFNSEIFSNILNIIYDEDVYWYRDMKVPSELSISINEKRWDSSVYKRKFFGYRSPLNFKEVPMSDRILIYYLYSIWVHISYNSTISKEEKKDYLKIFNNYTYTYPNDPKKNIIHDKKDFFQEIEKLNSSNSSLKKYFELLKNVNEKTLELEEKNSKNLIKLDDKNELIIKKFVKLYIDFLKKIPTTNSILNFQLSPKMSSGNLVIMQTLAILYDKLKGIKHNNVLLLLDEIEVYLHPNWQKKFLNLLISFLSSKFEDKSFHIILATHSPFLLSDIPKSNIVFLGEGKVKMEQTFGANIHTLLSNSFFMEDGLMGEFAKGKIQEIMDFLNNKKTLEDISTEEVQIKQVIESIGEPFLKQKLLEMYYRKFKNKALIKARKDELLAEQKRIEIELNKYD